MRHVRSATAVVLLTKCKRVLFRPCTVYTVVSPSCFPDKEHSKPLVGVAISEAPVVNVAALEL